MRIILVRHGEINGNEEVGSYGKEQLLRVAHLIQSLPGFSATKTAIITSRLKRAVDSGILIQKEIGIDIMLDGPFPLIHDIIGNPHGTKYIEQFSLSIEKIVAHNSEIENIIAVGHKPEIEYLLDQCRCYNDVGYDSIHQIDLKTKKAIFLPITNAS